MLKITKTTNLRVASGFPASLRVWELPLDGIAITTKSSKGGVVELYLHGKGKTYVGATIDANSTREQIPLPRDLEEIIITASQDTDILIEHMVGSGLAVASMHEALGGVTQTVVSKDEYEMGKDYWLTVVPGNAITLGFKDQLTYPFNYFLHFELLGTGAFGNMLIREAASLWLPLPKKGRIEVGAATKGIFQLGYTLYTSKEVEIKVETYKAATPHVQVTPNADNSF
jgi:hypothetical protein